MKIDTHSSAALTLAGMRIENTASSLLARIGSDAAFVDRPGRGNITRPTKPEPNTASR